MHDNLTHKLVREFFCGAWFKHRNTGSLSVTEQVAIDWILQHPEFQSDLENPLKAYNEEYSPENEKINPFLHLSMHLAITEQVAADKPPSIRNAYYTLIRKTGSEHDASHKIMEYLAEMIWQSQKNKSPMNFQKYSDNIQKLITMSPADVNGGAA